MKKNSLNQAAKMETYLVQAILCDKFEDLYVKATSEQEAIEKAKKMTSLKSRFVNFVI